MSQSEKQRIRAFFERTDGGPKRSRGQNFLVDMGVLQSIVRAMSLRPGEVVLEIGPGLGTLTGGLIDAGASVVAIEIERDFREYLPTRFDADRLHLIDGDATKTKVLRAAADKLRELAPGQQRFRVMGNLPYSSGTAIVQRLFDTWEHWSEATVLLQQEVTRRLTAPAGGSDRGYLSVLRENFGDMEELLTVHPSAFKPQPKVVSALGRLTFHEQPRLSGEEYRSFKQLVNRSFQQKRKKLRNSLKELKEATREPGAEALEAYADRRPETLRFDEFADLHHRLSG